MLYYLKFSLKENIPFCDLHYTINGKGICHISAKCSLCGRINTLEILPNTYAPYNSEKNEQFQSIVKFECRGIEPLEFDPRVGWRCVGTESATPFDDIDLNSLEWADYDEKVGEPVEINEMAFKFVPVKE